MGPRRKWGLPQLSLIISAQTIRLQQHMAQNHQLIFSAIAATMKKAEALHLYCQVSDSRILLNGKVYIIDLVNLDTLIYLCQSWMPWKWVTIELWHPHARLAVKIHDSSMFNQNLGISHHIGFLVINSPYHFLGEHGVCPFYSLYYPLVVSPWPSAAYDWFKQVHCQYSW